MSITLQDFAHPPKPVAPLYDRIDCEPASIAISADSQTASALLFLAEFHNEG